MSDPTDLRPLFADYASGRITADQLRVLEAALGGDAALRRQFIEYLNLDSALGDLAAIPEADEAATPLSVAGPLPSMTTDKTPKRTDRRAYSVGVLATALVLGVMLWFTTTGPGRGETLATLVTQVDAALLRSGELWDEALLPAGAYRLDRGLVHLQFANGAAVYLEAPAQFEIVTKQCLKLVSGSVSANVPPAGIGFTVETAEARVVDYGTEFSVEAESGSSEVHVFSGLVHVLAQRGESDQPEPIELHASEAIRIDDSANGPVAIRLAPERFIRTFDEPKRKYARTMRQLSPLAYYRMPIRRRGLIAEPPQYSGELLTGDGGHSPHAQGACSGGSLRVGGGSTGRGGRVDVPPPLETGQFTLTVFVYLETRPPGGMVATNIGGDTGNFALWLNEDGRLQATVRTADGDLQSVVVEELLPLATWRQLVLTADGRQLQIYIDGQLAASAPCAMLATSISDTVWFGTTPDATGLWDGRIDELAMFDRALSGEEIIALYQDALEEMAR